MSAIIKDSIELIGNTPLLHVKNIDTGFCNLYLKLESYNLGGSIKDRPAKNMIKEAEKELSDEKLDDQKRFIISQKVEVLKSLSLN